MRLGIPWDESKDGYATCAMYASPLAEIAGDVNVTWTPGIPQEIPCQYGMVYDTSVRASTYISEVNIIGLIVPSKLCQWFWNHNFHTHYTE